jgi:pteridine reductase
MLRKNHGHVVNMIDLLAERPWPQFLAYCASKAALGNLTLGLARELAPQVTVNGIAPGVVQWPDDYPKQEREKYLQRVPLARSGTPEDVAELVHYLVTGGSYITGQIIRLDGGRSIT